MEENLNSFLQKFPEFESEKQTLSTISSHAQKEVDASKDGKELNLGLCLLKLVKKFFRGKLALLQLNSEEKVLKPDIKALAILMYYLAEIKAIQKKFADCK